MQRAEHEGGMTVHPAQVRPMHRPCPARSSTYRTFQPQRPALADASYEEFPRRRLSRAPSLLRSAASTARSTGRQHKTARGCLRLSVLQPDLCQILSTPHYKIAQKTSPTRRADAGNTRGTWVKEGPQKEARKKMRITVPFGAVCTTVSIGDRSERRGRTGHLPRPACRHGTSGRGDSGGDREQVKQVGLGGGDQDRGGCGGGGQDAC
jgi:hypothetical protein